MAEEPASLLDVAEGLLSDPAEKAAFEADPQRYIQQHGLDDLSPTDLHDALGFVADSLPAPLAAQIEALPDPSMGGIEAIVHELGRLVGIDPNEGGDLGLGDDPLDGFDAEVAFDEPGGLDRPVGDDAEGGLDSAFDLLSDDAGDDGSFGEGSMGGGAEVGAWTDREPGDGAAAKFVDGASDTGFDSGSDPISGLDEAYGGAVPPVTHLGDEDEEPEDAFDETDFDDS